MEILNSYKDYIKTKREVKLLKRKSFKRKTILNIKNENQQYFNENIISLYDIDKYKLRNQKRQRQNEISSICRKINEEKKKMIFITSTIKPHKNLTENNIKSIKNKELLKNDNERMDEILKEQYEVFKEFNNKLVKHNYINKKNEKINLKTDFLRVLELTKKYNIHQHEIKLLNTLEETEELIKAIIYKRDKTDIGRIEIRLDFNLLEEIKNKGITLRINNKYIKLTFQTINFKQKDTRTYYKLKETEETRGNFIYLKPIHDIKNNNEHITKYLFKYLLKRSNEESNENKLFHHLGMKQKQYSHGFFTDKITKRELFNISSKLYRMIKHNNHNNEFLKKYEIDPKTTIYETRKLLNKNLIEYDDKEKKIYSIENDKKTEIFELFQFTKETKKGKWGELEVLQRKQENKFFSIEEEYKLKKLELKQKYEEYYFISKIYDKKRELKISNKLETQYNNIKNKFPLMTYNNMSKIQIGFSKFEKLREYEKELKKDWELNFLFRIYFEYEKEPKFIKMINLKNYKRTTLQEYKEEKEKILNELLEEREKKEKYFSNLIENKNYKIEQYEEF
jgi:hypothetical protein